jgi:hypothetical protein
VLQVRQRVHADTNAGEVLPAEVVRVLHESDAQQAYGIVFPESSGFLWSEDSERVPLVAPISAQRRIDVDFPEELACNKNRWQFITLRQAIAANLPGSAGY